MKWMFATAVLLIASVAVPASAAERAPQPPSIVEDYSYPGAAEIRTDRHIELISGDGRITLLDNCTGSQPKITVEVDTNDATEPSYCFAVKGDRGRLTLNLPRVYLIFAGDEQLNAKVTVNDTAQNVYVKPNGFVGVGAEDPDAGVLLELRAG